MSYVTQSLHRVVQRAPEALASIDGEERRNWRELRNDVARFAGALRAAGISEGDRVALLARNSGRYLDYLLGTFWAGDVINPVNTRWSAAEIARSLEDCGTRLLIVDAHFAPVIEAVRRDAPILQAVVGIDGSGQEWGIEQYAAWLAKGEPIDDTRPGFDATRAGSLRRVVYSASPIDGSLLERAMAALPDVGFVQAYGMTEVSPIATMLGPEDHSLQARTSGRRFSAGRATIAAEVKVVDDDDEEVGRGDVGEVVVRGSGVMLGYWGMPDATAAALRGGWMHTGDLGRMDDEGYLTIVDRLKDMIITGGENVYSAEVESASTSHPAVHQAAVIDIPDARWGEAVHAVVVLRPGVSCEAAMLRDHCRTLIAGYKVPNTITFTATLLLSAAGKILKTVLRQEAQLNAPLPAATEGDAA